MAKKEYFPRVKEAREALREKALDLFNKYELVIDAAISKGDLDVAGEHLRWLIEHMPAEDEVRMIDSSAAKPKEVEGVRGPQIQIGIALGPTTQIKALPPETVDAEVVKSE